MDSRIGLDYIVENREYISKLGAALDTNNAIVKKQVFELLSALCAYNAEGYTRAIETLEFYKNLKKERYRFKIVINELEKSNSTIEYQVALLAFINCVIISASTLQERIRIRNEFIGLKVLPVLNNLRKVAQSVGDIIVQLDVFEEQRECDEAQSLQGPDGLNLNSHLDVFYAILRQVADTPQEVPFLSILQHLLRIDPKEPVSDIIWDTTEKLVHRATLLENHEDSVRLLRTQSVQKFTCPHCRSYDATSPSRKPSGVPNSPLTANSNNHQQHNGPLSPLPQPPPTPASPASVHNNKQQQQQVVGGPAAAPPPPPPPPMPITNQPTAGGPPLPPPPPPPMLITINGNAPPAPPPIPGAPPPPPPCQLNVNGTHASHRPRTPEPGSGICDPAAVLLPQQDTPAPKSKMKTLNWGKIPPNKVIGKQNIWTIVANNHQDSPMTDIVDWNEMEGLFCLQTTSAQGSPKLGREGSASSSGYDTLDRKAKKESTEITMLDGKRSLNVNIFLKQFRSSNEDIIQLIKNGEHEDIGSEKLRGLLKILPEVDELDMLKSFNGDHKRLGNAEKFLLQLLEVPNYKLRIESMLLKEEFAANVSYLDPCINAMIYAGDDLINNTTLQELLYMVLVAGNFLNSGGYAGNAAGVKLSSLQKLTDIRANKPGMNLIHFVALQAEKRNPELLKFHTQLGALENASKTTSEQINNEINMLDTRIRKIKRQIEQPATDEDIKEQMLEFLQRAEAEVAVLQAGMKEVESMRLKLADFFCDDPATFRLEECFKIFQNFCDKFKQAIKENERRQQLEEQATLRRKQREEQLARRARQLGQAGTPVSDSEPPFLMDPTYDPRASPALSRRRMGSFNSGVDITNGFIRMESNDGMSPDITPNGSLRRRRSRVLAEEDDLMEFLRSSSGHEHNSRERKAYGSLDRSWARRARSGSSSRKRPELLNIDFGIDRERASSPAPLLAHPSPVTPASTPTTSSATTQQQQQAHEDVKPRISREWRQKIETWLQSNENDEKQNEEYKRKRRLVTANRRSIENDTENERKLDPLPEEKIMPSTPAPTPTTTSSNPVESINKANNNNNNNNNYQRVYNDWKPSKTLEQTDVVGTIQAIAEVSNAIDKAQRNQQLNSSTHNGYGGHNQEQKHASPHLTTAEELRQYRRQRSQEHNDKYNISSGGSGSSPLHSIAEEDRRKSIIQQLGEQDVNDRLQIYIRRPSSNALLETEKDDKPLMTENSRNSPGPTQPGTLNKTASNTKVNVNTEQQQLQQQQPKSPIVANSNQDDAFASLLTHHKSHNESAQYNSSRKEIDADNIETPPVTRRIIGSGVSGPNTTIVTVSMTDKPMTVEAAKEKATSVDNKCSEQDSPGHFDRYSSTRRTRRYKRPTDYSSGNEELTSSRESNESPASATGNKIRQSSSASEIRRLQQQQQQQQQQQPKSQKSPTPVEEKNHKGKTIQKLEKVGRHISSINQEDVREAIRNLKSPTGTPERIWSPPREITPETQNGIRLVNGGTTTTTLKVHAHHHELNDEGFEETQSLVSDTPSHGKEESTNSSCNEANETTVPATKSSKSSVKHRQPTNNSITTMTSRLADRLHNAQRMRTTPSQQQQQQQQQQSTTQGIKSQNNHSNHQTIVKRTPSSVSSSATTNNRTNPLRMPNGILIQSPARHSLRTKSTHQDTPPTHSSPSHLAIGKRDVERSSSRNSLRSSRSSINSAASTNTVVRRMPTTSTVLVHKSNTPLHTVSVDSSPSKRPLAAQNTRSTAYVRSGVPASRSSSSGSSVGQSVVVIRKSNPNGTMGSSRTSSTLLGGSTSFKENQTNQGNSAVNGRAHAARSAVLVKTAMAHLPSTRLNNVGGGGGGNGGGSAVQQRSNSSTRGVSSFMRPTASSATKRSK